MAMSPYPRNLLGGVDGSVATEGGSGSDAVEDVIQGFGTFRAPVLDDDAVQVWTDRPIFGLPLDPILVAVEQVVLALAHRVVAQVPLKLGHGVIEADRFGSGGQHVYLEITGDLDGFGALCLGRGELPYRRRAG